jgi:diguanylate cyclase (GGDEF)-like protein
MTVAFATVALLLYGVVSLVIAYRTSMQVSERSLSITSEILTQGIAVFNLFDQKMELYMVAQQLSRSNAKNLDWFLDREINRLQRYDSVALFDGQGRRIWADGFLQEVELDKKTFSQIKVRNIVDAYGKYKKSYYILQGVPFRNWDDSYFLVGGLEESTTNTLSQMGNSFRFMETGFGVVFGESGSSSQVLYGGKRLPKSREVLTAVVEADFGKMVPLDEGPYHYYIYKKRISSTPLYMTFFISKLEVLSGIYRTIVSQILIFVILGLFIWFLVGSAVSKITEPIESLTSSMSQVAEGDYQVEVQVIPRKDEIGVLSKAFAHLVDSVRDYSEKLRELSIHDALTGLFNNREFETRFDKEWERSVRYTVPLSFFMSDIDLFKHFNDDFGHQVGDEVLKSVAKVFQENIRTSDTAFRYGGEEFCVVLPETNLEKARVVAEKLRRKVEELPACMAEGKETRKITISIGIASFPECALEKKQLIVLADDALYKAKEKGRNRVEVAEAVNAAVLKEAMS